MKVSFSKILNYSLPFSSPFDAIVYSESGSYTAWAIFFDNKINITWKVFEHIKTHELSFEKDSEFEIDNINGYIDFTYMGIDHALRIMVPNAW